MTMGEVDQEDDQKADGRSGWKEILVNAKLKIENKGQNTELSGVCPLRKLKPAMDRSAM